MAELSNRVYNDDTPLKHLMRTNRKSYKRELTKLILETIAEGALVVAVAGFAGHRGPQMITRFAKYKIKYLRHTLRRLHKLKLIELKQDHEGRMIAKLSAAGEAALERKTLWDMDLEKPAQWDGIWRIVAFDIDVTKKLSRDSLRGHLKALRFYPLQKSVFVTPYSCEKELGRICKYYEIEKAVSLLLAHFLGQHEQEARRYFNLPLSPSPHS